MKARHPFALVCALALLAVWTLITPATARDFSKVEIKTEKVADGLYMLIGQGGNIAVSIGSDGVFMVDDQFAPLTPKIQAAVAKLTDQPVRFVINTHWHRDHVGGNEALAKAGAITVAHENVRTRLKSGGELKYLPLLDRTVPPGDGLKLPIVTFQESVSFHFNGGEIEVFKLPDSHTDGDSAVIFHKQNAIHVGDTIRVNYPYIDVGSGGSLDGTIETTNVLLSLMDAETKIISGHAPVIGREKVTAYRDMLETVRSRMQALVAAGKTEAEIQDMRPLLDLDETWGGGFINATLLIKAVYADLTRED